MRAKKPVIPSTLQRLNPRLEKSIATYAATAGAVGVALLAAAKPAQAEIVYTKTRVTIGQALPYLLDLNHDGITDFTIGFCSCRAQGTGLGVLSYGEAFRHARNTTGSENGVIEQPGNSGSAAALMSGAPIGPKQVFHSIGGSAQMAFWGSYISFTYAGGPWSDVTGRYLGLKFLIDGEFHYGWARLTVSKKLNHVVLTGYAYETIANKHLTAGQTSESAEEARSYGEQVGPALGMLALGADGMALWRREDSLEAVAAPKSTVS